MIHYRSFIGIVLCTLSWPVLAGQLSISDQQLSRSEITFQSIYKHYGVENTPLLRENYPYSEDQQVTYLADDEQNSKKKPFAYLWPYSGSLSAITTLYETEKTPEYLNFLENKVLLGLEQYFDARRLPVAYASYINTAPKSDRFYDDNVWIGLDFTDLYLYSSNKKYLDKAVSIWKFIESGTDTLLGGGIYWCEQKKGSKNTCSNAPGAVYALKLFEATKDSSYLYQGKSLYSWTKDKLQDNKDYLYYDHISLQGRIGRTKYAYNSGQMLQAAALLYKLTKDKTYLVDAQNIASACYGYFFHDFVSDKGEEFRMINKGNVWFTAIMLRGFVELYHVDNNKQYIGAFKQNIDYAWQHMREENGLFNSDWSGRKIDASKWLLTQFAMVEMYARLDDLKFDKVQK